MTFIARELNSKKKLPRLSKNTEVDEFCVGNCNQKNCFTGNSVIYGKSVTYLGNYGKLETQVRRFKILLISVIICGLSKNDVICSKLPKIL